uniref:CD72 molecule n=1 Tax=Pipistrellus kuhlii TaxID=59472 RepID=A0A7J7W2P7_PIPKU|nr:CD72 molecule [Pipistrellus kuhlii]
MGRMKPGLEPWLGRASGSVGRKDSDHTEKACGPGSQERSRGHGRGVAGGRPFGALHCLLGLGSVKVEQRERVRGRPE